MKLADKAKKEQELILTYSVGIFMLSLISEWGALERRGSLAVIHNTITRKHNVFHKQIDEINKSTRKQTSEKCQLFIKASSCSILAWQTVELGVKIALNTVILNLYRLNKESFNRVYGIKEEVFIKQNANSEKNNTTLQSCRIARILTDEVKKSFDSIPDVNIYDKKFKKK